MTLDRLSKHCAARGMHRIYMYNGHDNEERPNWRQGDSAQFNVNVRVWLNQGCAWATLENKWNNLTHSSPLAMLEDQHVERVCGSIGVMSRFGEHYPSLQEVA